MKNPFNKIFKKEEKKRCREKDIADIQKEIDKLVELQANYMEKIESNEIVPGDEQFEQTIQALESWSRQIKELRAEQARLVYGDDEHDHTDTWIKVGGTAACLAMIIVADMYISDCEKNDGMLLKPKLIRFNSIPKII